jgi:hypothetical protein
MVTCLLGCELADRWEDPEGVTSQHDDIRWLTIHHARNFSIGNVLDRIGASGVLGNADVIVVGDTRKRVVDNILENAAILDGIVDVWLFFGRKIDAFCIAAAFNVEDTSVGPYVFIVTNQETAGIRRKCGFTSARQTEEKSNIVVFDADIGRGMK